MNHTISSSAAPGAAPPQAPPRRRPPLWAGWLLLGAALIGLHYALPALGAPGGWQAAVYCLISGGSAVAVGAGVRVHRPPSALPWWLVAASQVMFTVADASYYVITALRGDTAYPALSNVLYLLQYPILGLALVLFIRRRTPGGDGPAMIDASVVTVGATLLYWVFLIGPTMTTPGISPADRFASVAFPVMDLLVLTVAVRLVFGGGVRNRSYHLLSAVLGLVLLADTGYGLQSLTGEYIPGGWLDLGWLTSYLLLGASALHPSMTRLDERVEQGPPELGRTRFVLMSGATLMAPAVLVLQYGRQGDLDLLVLAAASATLFLLVLVRMSGLVAAQRRLAMTDALTGLSTRRSLQQRIRHEAARAVRRGTAAGLLVIDVDHFKRVNDTYGHPAGDEVLTETARRIRAACRAEDLVARFGGEEFAVLVPRTTADGLAALAERIRAAVAAGPVTVGGSVAVPVTVSVGGAAVPLHVRTVEELFQAADAALYEAKRAGRDRVVLGPAEVPPPDTGAAEPGPVRGPGPACDPAAEPAPGTDAGTQEQVARWAAALTGAMGADGNGPASRLHVQGVCLAWAMMRTGVGGRPVWPVRQAAEELRRCGRTHLDPVIVDAFLELVAAGADGSGTDRFRPVA
ncbi:diguanylate cyclase [Planomonospora corallina]|uniref:Diguanylate cyclase n=1 Tax=Planomonospora corallina TaxID=1806052 RepID=A0ABV8ID38_9ACTN